MKKFSFLSFCGVFISIILGISLPGFCEQTVKFESEIKDGLTQPVDVALNPNGQLFVLNEGKSVFIFDSQGKEQSSFALNPDSVAQGQGYNATSMDSSSYGRIVFADTSNQRVGVFQLSGENLFAFGAQGNLSGQFKALSSVKTDAFGFIYAADQENKRILIFTPNGVLFKEIAVDSPLVDIALDRRGNIYALLPDVGKIQKFSSDGKRIAEVTCQLNGKDQIQKSNRLHVDAWGQIYLTQSKEERVVKIEQDGSVLISFGSQGHGRGQFVGIGTVASDLTGRVYVTDSGNGRVQVFKISTPLKSPMEPMKSAQLFLDFDSTIDAQEGIAHIFSLPGKGLFGVSDKKHFVGVWGDTNFTIGSEGAGLGALYKPASLYVTLNSRIYVADTGNHRVQIFNSDGSVNYEFGQYGNRPGQFHLPQSIVVNSKGMIFVADTLNNRIEIFNQDGIYLSAIGQDDQGGAPKTMDHCQNLNLPKVLAVDSKDQLYVVDEDTTKIKVFDETGACLKTITAQAPQAFVKIADISFDQNDNLYIADAGQSKIMIFDAFRNFVFAFGCPGSGRGYFKQLSSISARDGKIFVADYESNQIQVFKYSPDGLLVKPQRLYATKTASPPTNTDNNDVLRYTMARDEAYTLATQELMDSLGFSKEYISRFIRIDSIESLNDAKIKVTVSIPKFIPREIRSPETSMPKSGG